MACFIVPAAEAVVTTVIKKTSEKKEATNIFLSKIGWLNNMLWGGSALLAFEHLWHGEIVPWFPFLTNAANPVDMAEMLAEMATSGVGMAVLVTGVWAVMVKACENMEKTPVKEAVAEKASI